MAISRGTEIFRVGKWTLVAGVIITITVVGAIAGIPMIIVGLIFVFWGTGIKVEEEGRRLPRPKRRCPREEDGVGTKIG